MAKLSAPLAAVLVAALATPAAAQVAGTYSGTSADGNGVSFTLATDPNTGNLQITGAGVGFTAPCKKSTYVLNTGWGWNPGTEITGKTVTSVNDGNYFDITFKLKFSADNQSATGTIATVSPALNNAVEPARKALFCASPKQALSVTLQAGGARLPALQRGQMIHFEQPASTKTH